jgi:hypothetical protein
MRKQILTAGALATAALLAAVPAHAQSWRTVNSARQSSGEETLYLNVEYGAGRLNIAPAKKNGLLYEAQFRYDEERFRPVTEYRKESETLTLGVRSLDKNGVKLDRSRTEQARADIGVSAAIPTRLDLQFGAGEAAIELGGLSLKDVKLSTGASETRVRFGAPNRLVAERVKIEAGAADLRVEGLGNARAEKIEFSGGVGSTVLDFGGQWTHSALASVQMGIGSVTLRLPQSIGVRVDKNSFLTSFDSHGFIKRGSSYYTANWDDAPIRLTLDINAALGSINVEWIR